MQKIFRYALRALAGAGLAAVLYLAAAWFVPYVAVAAEQDGEAATVSAYIMTNGVHTDIVMPAVTPYVDWRGRFKPEHTLAARPDYPYVAVGWGDKGFYLNKPTWADLKASTALSAAFGLGGSALHVTFYPDMREGGTVRRFEMSARQYRRLIEYIDRSAAKDAAGRYVPLQTDAVYGGNDAFYEARGRYGLFYTCNTWANGALKSARQKAAWWTLTDEGIFRHYR